MSNPTDSQPPPIANDLPAIWSLVIDDMRQRRDAVGAHNGRDALVDTYQECLDMAVCLRRAIFERDGK